MQPSPIRNSARRYDNLAQPPAAGAAAGLIWRPDASEVATCCENNALCGTIRDAYPEILAARVVETMWRAGRYASFQTAALSHQIGLHWHRFGNSSGRSTVSAHAWLALEGSARKALLEALKLQDRVWPNPHA